jgi:hypothetical protein
MSKGKINIPADLLANGPRGLIGGIMAGIGSTNLQTVLRTAGVQTPAVVAPAAPTEQQRPAPPETTNERKQTS